MRKYSTYKQSGVEWLGEIPNEWNSTIFNRILKEIKDGTHGSFKRVEEGRVLLSAKNVQSDKIEITEDESLICEDDYISIIKNGFPQKNDLLLTIVGTIGRAYVYELDYPLAFQRSVAFLRFKKNNNIKFYYYQVQSNLFLSQLYSLAKTSAQSGVYLSDIKGSIALVPPLLDQNSIVAFLDYKTAQIDNFIANRQKQIELLREQKAGIINKAVTKGINPNAKMKASGIEWIGDIPEHWLVIRLKYIIKTMASGVSVNSDDEPAEPHEFGILKTSCVYTGEFNPYENKRILENEYNRMTCPVKKNTIIISRMNTPELVGANGFVDKDYERLFLPDRLWQTVFFSKAKIVPKWLSYFLASNRFRTLLSSLATGTSASMKNITQNDVLGSFICLPPVEEQNEIVDFFIKEILIMDNLISKYQKQIELMQEYRTSLISQAVTGKIDVRDWEPKIKEYSIEKPENLLVAEE